MDKNIDVVCVGSATIDVFLMLHKLKNFTYDKFSNQISFTLGAKVPLDEYTITLGGNACNVSVGLSRLGISTSLAAEVGSDELSKMIPNTLTYEGVDQTYLKREVTNEPYFNVILSYDGERTILEEKNPLGIDLDVGRMSAKLVYLTSLRGNWHETYDKVFRLYHDCKFAFNPGSRQLADSKEDIIKILQSIHFLFVNLQEAQALTGEENTDIKFLMRKLKSYGAKTIVITDGINGSYAADKDDIIYQIGVCSIKKPVERTGAGDAYATGFLYGVLSNYPIADAMKYGAISSESVIREIGAQKGLLTKEEIEEKFESYDNLKAVKI
ncbi:MAG: hypothetical protein US96_C0017G0006 [Candidatus Woesebacteria bacterium GW2011_GWB1_38_5b]|uniref:Carbohydrate kinase PfkB domain-containing protein n=1 Tax=Candidatus Woesebacteria bacterium GW2011_GWB1_38_5b TaxID=1618569 RepID=A0A0G0KHW5_9BACT|nr:MAG: hypothetical protein US96_C0017G0006 [Candidatus Woesebacteria bacterium GW2011_GWB1_38_5b]OGH47235.1 MAG: hypothetical protein A3A51_01765 [Candidatus Levybacteria bacterium RIFCSPLOWO2_01_FULL_39_10]